MCTSLGTVCAIPFSKHSLSLLSLPYNLKRKKKKKKKSDLAKPMKDPEVIHYMSGLYSEKSTHQIQ